MIHHVQWTLVLHQDVTLKFIEHTVASIHQIQAGIPTDKNSTLAAFLLRSVHHMYSMAYRSHVYAHISLI